ncbi:unnamed protein product [Penicillium roqueforti FM164]|uniref:Genomic scaffold, ProqFM164S04 n=1 Tax=Penicillium roqueforti (strain FM164) TaxID=1365484 RepID=W6QIU3_PENRF|nr:unnamed protein product [Penicillium roqueforti FM164]
MKSIRHITTRSLTPFRGQLFPMPPREALLPQNELAWLPEERKTAHELIEHPFL